MPEQLQARLTGFVEAEIERYSGVIEAAKEKASQHAKDVEEVEEVEDEDEDEEDDDEKKKKGKAKAAKAKAKRVETAPKKKAEKLTPVELRGEHDLVSSRWRVTVLILFVPLSRKGRETRSAGGRRSL